ncbi:MAG: trigger factor [Alphaproteobacteria bacterium]|nr:trigger factor [Alphaproteobacteria bacterium]
MQVTETLNEGLKRKLDLSIPVADLTSQLDAKLNDLKTKVRLNGFRPGKVPFGHLKKLYGRSAMTEVMQEAIDEGVKKTLEERAERAAAQPKVDLSEDQAVLNRIIDGEADLAFSVSYEVLPKIEIMDFRKISIERPVVEVTEAEIDEQIARIVESNRPYEEKPQGEKLAGDDRATISFTGHIDGKPFEGGSSESSQIVIGSNRFIPGFEEQLVGMTLGAKEQITVEFPADYGGAGLAGKTALFDIEVLAADAPGKLAVDDDFAKTLGVDSLDKLREMVSQQIAGQHNELTRRRVKRLVLDALDEGHKLEVPAQMVEMEFDTIWKRVLHEIEQHGRSFEDEDTTEEKARAEYETIAERRVRLGLVVAEVGEANSIKITDEEMQQALVNEVRRYPGQEQQVYDLYRKNPQALAGLRAPIYEDKVVDYILELAEVKEVKISREDLVKLVQEDDGLEESLQHDHHHGDDGQPGNGDTDSGDTDSGAPEPEQGAEPPK